MPAVASPALAADDPFEAILVEDLSRFTRHNERYRGLWIWNKTRFLKDAVPFKSLAQ